MPLLGVNLDHVATIRQARGTNEPDPVHAVVLAEIGGADSITLHLREDRRHIQDRDVRLVRQMTRLPLNLEMATSPEITALALETLPHQCTLVPEKREELTTEGGLELRGNRSRVEECVGQLKAAGIKVSLFIDPDVAQIEIAQQLAVDAVEIHTGRYADAGTDEEREEEFDALQEAGEFAIQKGLTLNMGHGLTYRNVRPIAEIGGIYELNIGHSIIAHAVMVGMERAVQEMKDLLYD